METRTYGSLRRLREQSRDLSRLSREMVAAQRRWLPNARLCIVRFHLVKLAGKALSDLRRRVEADRFISQALRKELKGSWRPLVMGREKLLAHDDEYAMEMSERRSRVQRALSLTDEEVNKIPRLRARKPLSDMLERLLSQRQVTGLPSKWPKLMTLEDLDARMSP